MLNPSSSLDTLDICKPLFDKFDLNAFSYSRVFNDGTRSELWTDAAAFEHTFYKARYIVGAYTPQYFKNKERYSFLKNKIETYPSDIKERYRKQLIDQRDYFSHDHCFVIINHQEKLCEYFIFYAPTSNDMAINCYLNNISEFEEFCKYFLQKAEKLIIAADEHRIPGAEIVMITKFEDHARRKQAMTSREKEIARLLVTGATIKDVGVALKISPRTVESHVERMKIKYGCTRKSSLVKALYLSRHSLG